MRILVHSVPTTPEEPHELAVERASAMMELPCDAVQEGWLYKTSVDARKRSRARFVHSVLLEVEEQAGSALLARIPANQAALYQSPRLQLTPGSVRLEHRPVIAGFGPAGMFAGLLLARQGYRPIVLERGADVDRRTALVEQFWKTGQLDERTNVQFGEGGAGTFSDGKLTTRIGDEKCAWVLEELVRLGAPEEILRQAKPHIGTDRLRLVVKRLREELIRLGGEVHFETSLTGLRTQNGRLCAVLTEHGEIACEQLILAVGHSAREVFPMLLEQGLELESKAFSVGVRIEHLQADIDRGCYGNLAGHPALPKAEYQLSHREGTRGVYTFCMCPGGVVVPAASQNGMVVVNGMSDFARAGKNANAALVVSVSAEDFGAHPLDGMRFQQQLERRAFEMGGGYRAPMQTVGLFLDGKPGAALGRVSPSYACGAVPGDLSALFPAVVTSMLQTGIARFERRLPGFAAPDTVLTGVETRTSSPVRVVRGQDLQATRLPGVYPCAEGAGYAGGIISAAVDGLRCAQAIIEQYAPLDGLSA